MDNNQNNQFAGQPVNNTTAVDPNQSQQQVVNQAQPIQGQEPITAQVQQPVATNYVMPVARAGQLIAQPISVKAEFLRASTRTVKEGDQVKEILILEFKNFPTAVIRNINQAKGDLIEIYTKQQLDNMNSTLAVATYNRYFKNRTVELSASYHEAGAIHTVTAESALYKNGQATIGTQVPTTSEGIWVDGFLRVEQTQEELDAIIKRELEAIASLAKANTGLLV